MSLRGTVGANTFFLSLKNWPPHWENDPCRHQYRQGPTPMDTHRWVVPHSDCSLAKSNLAKAKLETASWWSQRLKYILSVQPVTNSIVAIFFNSTHLWFDEFSIFQCNKALEFFCMHRHAWKFTRCTMGAITIVHMGWIPTVSYSNTYQQDPT